MLVFEGLTEVGRFADLHGVQILDRPGRFAFSSSPLYNSANCSDGIL